MRDVIAESASDPALRGLVLTGAGGKAFVAGADIAGMVGMDPAEAKAFAGLGMSVMGALERFPAPVLAAVDGFALGGGMELALACDMIYASPRSKFGLPEVKLGVNPGFGGTQRLTRLVGPNTARELIFTGRMISASRALELGIVQAVVEDGSVVDYCCALIEEISGNGPLAVAACKDLILGLGNRTIDGGLEAEQSTFSSLFKTADRKEGMMAFLEKRKAGFTRQ
jgi:enoyl-CoA hydratase